MRTEHITTVGRPLAERFHHFLAVMARPAGVSRRFTDLTAVCYGELGLAHRQVLDQKLIFERSYDEIGHALGLTRESVRLRIRRARETLRGRLSEVSSDFAAGRSG